MGGGQTAVEKSRLVLLLVREQRTGKKSLGPVDAHAAGERIDLQIEKRMEKQRGREQTHTKRRRNGRKLRGASRVYNHLLLSVFKPPLVHMLAHEPLKMKDQAICNTPELARGRAPDELKSRFDVFLGCALSRCPFPLPSSDFGLGFGPFRGG